MLISKTVLLVTAKLYQSQIVWEGWETQVSQRAATYTYVVQHSKKWELGIMRGLSLPMFEILLS